MRACMTASCCVTVCKEGINHDVIPSKTENGNPSIHLHTHIHPHHTRIGVVTLRGRYQTLISQSDELAFLGTRGLALLNNLLRPDAPSAVKSACLSNKSRVWRCARGGADTHVSRHHIIKIHFNPHSQGPPPGGASTHQPPPGRRRHHHHPNPHHHHHHHHDRGILLLPLQHHRRLGANTAGRRRSGRAGPFGERAGAGQGPQWADAPGRLNVWGGWFD